MYSFGVVASYTTRYGSFGGELVHAWPCRPYIIPYYFGIVAMGGVGRLQTTLPVGILTLGDAKLVFDPLATNWTKVLLAFPRTEGL